MPQERRPYKDHHLTYFDIKKGRYIYTTPKDWARTHKNHFAAKWTFEDDKTTPIVTKIESVLKDKYGFVEFTYDAVVVLCNFDTELEFNKGTYTR